MSADAPLRLYEAVIEVPSREVEHFIEALRGPGRVRLLIEVEARDVWEAAELLEEATTVWQPSRGAYWREWWRKRLRLRRRPLEEVARARA